MTFKVKKIILNLKSTIKDAAINLNKSASKIVLVVGNNQKFIGTVTDGDIRRCLIKKKKN